MFIGEWTSKFGLHITMETLILFTFTFFFSNTTNYSMRLGDSGDEEVAMDSNESPLKWADMSAVQLLNTITEDAHIYSRRSVL